MSVPMRWQAPEIVPESVPATPAPLRRRAAHRAQPLRTIVVMSALCLAMSACTALGIRIGSVNAASTQSLRLISAPNPNGRALLTNATLERRLGFVTVTGSVLSHAKQNLPHVEAIVELLDSQNRTLQMETALIAYDPLPTGQAAPFRVEMRDNPQAVSYRVGFRQMFGAPLD